MFDSKLTPVINLPTSVPVPVVTYSTDGASPVTTASKTDKISLHVSSEFTTHTAPISFVDGKHKLGLVQDTKNQPVLFSIGTNERLYCFRLEKGGAEAWQSYDITPNTGSTSRVATFDVQHSTGYFTIAVALKADNKTDLFTCVFKKSDFDPSAISWAARSPQASIGSRTITSIACGGADTDKYPIITVGTQATSTVVATHYWVDTDPSNTSPWNASPLPEVSASVLDVAPGKLPSGIGAGCYTLYARNDESIGCSFDNSSSSMSVSMLLSDLGKVRGICSTVTPYYNATDLFVAAEKGIGFFSHFRPDKKPQIILPDISFKQVVASEYYKTIVVLAVSDHDELFYIQGTRGDKISFLTSGLPIRNNVGRISVAYNVRAGAVELMYIDNNQTQIKHLWRDPATFTWSGSSVSVLSPKGNGATSARTLSYPAFISAITVVNATTGMSVGAGYPIALTSEWVYATVNGRTYSLDNSPTTVETDAYGRVTIVQQTTEGLSSPSYNIKLTRFTENNPVSVRVNPMQRVISQLAKYGTADSLKNAKTTDGRKVRFGNSASDNFDAAATVLSQFAPLVHNVDPEVGKQIVPSAQPLDQDKTLAFEKVNGKIVKTSDNWFLQSVQNVAEFLGDVWETIKGGLRSAFKFAVRIAGKVVSFVVSIVGRVFSFVISELGPLVRSFAGFLKEALGIDITGFLDWLGFVFDWKNIKETQGHLVRFVNGAFKSMSEWFEVNRPVIERSCDNAKKRISEYLEDNRIPPTSPDASKTENPLLGVFGWILDNPILQLFMKYHPLTWLQGELGDIIGDDIKLPDMSPLLDIVKRVLPKLFSNTSNIVSQLRQSIASHIVDLVNGKKDLGTVITDLIGDFFWSLFDGMRAAVLAVFDIVGDLVSAVVNFFTQEIKVPFITDLWTAITDEKLTVMNVLTVIPAVAFNIYFGAVYAKLPFANDMLGDPTRILPTREQLKLPDLVSDPDSLSFPSSNLEVADQLKTPIVKSTGSFAQYRTLTPEKGLGYLSLEADSGKGLGYLSLKADSGKEHEDGKAEEDEFEKKVHPFHIAEAIIGLLSAIFGAGFTLVEVIEAMAHDQGGGSTVTVTGRQFNTSIIKHLKIVSVTLVCISSFGSIVAATVNPLWKQPGKANALNAIIISKMTGFVAHISGWLLVVAGPDTRSIGALAVTLGTLLQAGLGAFFEFLADLSECGASVSGCVAILSHDNPQVLPYALGTSAGFDGLNFVFGSCAIAAFVGHWGANKH